MVLTGSQGSGGQVAALNHQRQGDCSYHNGQPRQSNVHSGLTCNGQHWQSDFHGGLTQMDLCYWLINCVSRHETDKEPTELWFDPYKQESSQTIERKATLDCGKREPISRLEPVCRPRNPLNEGMARLS